MTPATLQTDPQPVFTQPLKRRAATHHHPMPEERSEAGIVRAAAIAAGSTGLEPEPRERLARASTACWHHLGIQPDVSRAALKVVADPKDPLSKVFT